MTVLELISAGWITLLTFIIGVVIVFFEYGEHHKFKEILLFLYLFVEFLPMLLYILAILLPELSAHLLLPWVVLNVILLLISSILLFSFSMPNPTLYNVLMAVGISILFIFPVVFIIFMFLPLIVFTKKLVPNYKKRMQRSLLYRKVTRTKTAEAREKEAILRRKEQVKNVVITDKDFEQFVYVNRAAQKWKTKLNKIKEPEDEIKDILEEGNITVIEPCETKKLHEDIENGDIVGGVRDGQLVVTSISTVGETGKIVTDV